MRYRDFAVLPDGLPVGPRNLITDVGGLTVGHHTVREESPNKLRTGLSVLTIKDVLASPVSAGCHVLNGFGKSMGLVQVEELGTIESPIYFTNTLSIGAVHQGAVRQAILEKPDLRTYNPVVMECNDGTLSNIGALAVKEEMVALAHADAKQDFAQGSVGAGTGMICFGFKGGIGSSSRVLRIDGRDYTIGAMVLSNFGRQEDLRLPGIDLDFTGKEGSEKGSLILVVATDIPLLPHHLKRVARHMGLAIGLLGAPGYHGSGDIALAFSTTAHLGAGPSIQSKELVLNDGEIMSAIFKASGWACAEAILDSMICSPATEGFRRNVTSLRDGLTNAGYGSRR